MQWDAQKFVKREAKVLNSSHKDKDKHILCDFAIEIFVQQCCTLNWKFLITEIRQNNQNTILKIIDESQENFLFTSNTCKTTQRYKFKLSFYFYAFDSIFNNFIKLDGWDKAG